MKVISWDFEAIQLKIQPTSVGYECCSYNILQALGLITCLMTFVFVGIWDRKLTVCWGFSFPTCQVRVVRFYVGCPATSFSSSSAGPQLQALDRSIPRRTRTASTGSECSPTASSGSKCSPPDLNHKESPKIYQIECQKECQNICQKACQNRCQIECQKECQSICQKE